MNLRRHSEEQQRFQWVCAAAFSQSLSLSHSQRHGVCIQLASFSLHSPPAGCSLEKEKLYLAAEEEIYSSINSHRVKRLPVQLHFLLYQLANSQVVSTIAIATSIAARFSLCIFSLSSPSVCPLFNDNRIYCRCRCRRRHRLQLRVATASSHRVPLINGHV